jgi:hypothetical protein
MVDLRTLGKQEVEPNRHKSENAEGFLGKGPPDAVDLYINSMVHGTNAENPRP